MSNSKASRTGSLCGLCCGIFTLLMLAAGWASAGNLLEVEAADFDGPAQGQVVYYRWDEAKGSFEPLKAADLEDGKHRIGLAPGRYAVEITYTETTPQQVFRSAEVVFDDGEAQTVATYFGKAAVEVAAHDNDGKGEAECSVYFYEKDAAAEGGYRFLTSKPLPELIEGTYLHVPPGEYRVKVFYHETVPPGEKGTADFAIEDGEIVRVEGQFRIGPLKAMKQAAAKQEAGAVAPAPTPEEGAPKK